MGIKYFATATLATLIAIANLQAQAPADPLAGAAPAPDNTAPLPADLSLNPADTNAPAVKKPKAHVKKHAKSAAAKPAQKGSAFQGKLTDIDRVAMTITVTGAEKHVLKITSNTRINKDGKPAILADAVKDEVVSGQCVKGTDGSEEAVIVNFGKAITKPKAPAKPKVHKTKDSVPGDNIPASDGTEPVAPAPIVPINPEPVPAPVK